MESYQGVKFNHIQRKATFTYDDKLTELNRIAYIFSQLGLTPVHPEGAYGNQSYRTPTDSFIITKSGMTPEAQLQIDNYCEIVDYNSTTNTFSTNGTATPSSECFLHNEIYSAFPGISVILHGHSSLLNDYTSALNIPETTQFHDYGTMELAQSALELAEEGFLFFMLKDHGFVALGTTIQSAGDMVLDYYGQLINFLKNK
ncbi:class II aldolase/adducin family protein [Desulforhopalus sp. 52FAK]